MDEFIASLPALGNIHPALPGVLLLFFAIGFIAYRMRQNAGLMPGEPFFILGMGVLAGHHVAGTGTEGVWPDVVYFMAWAVMLVGAVVLRLHNTRANRPRSA